MFGISGFFKNIQNSFAKEVLLRSKIKEIIKKHTNIDIEIENLTCKNSLISIKKANPTILSVIFIKKIKILEDLNTFGYKITDIR